MSTEIPPKISRFLAWAAACVQREERGVLADLRHGFSLATEHRAWPHVAKWCDLANDRDRRIWITIAAGFATHQRTVTSGNLGATMRQMAVSGAGGKVEEALKSFDGRFRRLLTCSTALDVCEHLPAIIRAAKRKEVGINFEQLFWDLVTWESPKRDVRVQWAAQYWDAEDPQEGGDTQ